MNVWKVVQNQEYGIAKLMQTGSVLGNVRIGRKIISQENVYDCRLDMIRATNGAKIDDY